MNVNENVLILKNMKQIPKAQQGISLFDFVLWFTIVGIVILAIYNIYLPSKSQANSQIMVTELQALQSSVRAIYSNNPNAYKDVKIADLGDLPASITKDASGNYNSSVGGAVTVAADKEINKFAINYAAVPKTICLIVKNKVSLSGFTTDADACKNDGKVSFISN